VGRKALKNLPATIATQTTLTDEQLEEYSKEFTGVLTPIKEKKLQFLKVFNSKRCHIAQAMKAIGRTRATYENWRRTDPIFKKAVDEIKAALFDDIESSIYGDCLSGDKLMKMFVAKTQMQDRGFIESVHIQHEGKIQHEHILGKSQIVPPDEIILERINNNPDLTDKAKQDILNKLNIKQTQEQDPEELEPEYTVEAVRGITP